MAPSAVLVLVLLKLKGPSCPATLLVLERPTRRRFAGRTVLGILRAVTTRYEFTLEVRARELDRATSPVHRGAEIRVYPVGGRDSDAGCAHLSQ
jgi:hypothetical protein